MNAERIKQIQSQTAYPDSLSVQKALMQVWNECAQELNRINDYGRQQFNRGCMDLDLIKYEDWKSTNSIENR